MNYPRGPLARGSSFKRGPYDGRSGFVEPDPGEIGGTPWYVLGSATHENITRAILSEPGFGAVVIPGAARCPGGFYEIGLVVDNTGGFHFFREAGGAWYSKNSVGPAILGKGNLTPYTPTVTRFGIREH